MPRTSGSDARIIVIVWCLSSACQWLEGVARTIDREGSWHRGRGDVSGWDGLTSAQHEFARSALEQDQIGILEMGKHSQKSARFNDLAAGWRRGVGASSHGLLPVQQALRVVRRDRWGGTEQAV